jgi:hypothetical protein
MAFRAFTDCLHLERSYKRAESVNGLDVLLGPGRILTNEFVEVGSWLRASSYGSHRWDRLDSAGPWPQQIYFEHVVKPALAHNLETFAQAGGSDQAKLRSFRQENNPSFPSLVEMDGREGLSYPVHSRGCHLALFGGRTTNVRCRRCNCCCHYLNGLPFQS